LAISYIDFELPELLAKYDRGKQPSLFDNEHTLKVEL